MIEKVSIRDGGGGVIEDGGGARLHAVPCRCSPSAEHMQAFTPKVANFHTVPTVKTGKIDLPQYR